MTQRIGYDEYQKELERKRQAAERKQKEEQKKIEAEKQKKEQARLAKAKEKLERAKRRIIARRVRPFLLCSVIKGALLGQIIGIMIGSAFFGLDHLFEGEWDPNTNTETTARYDTYGEAIRSAYGMGDWEDDPFGAGFDTFMNLLITCVAMGIVVSRDAKDKKEKTNRLFRALEKMKNGCGTVELDRVIEELNIDVNKILESMSEKDRSYFESLAKGNLSTLNYERCVAIIRGYLKAHPKEYAEVIKVIDEAVLPESIRKKYGAGKITSFVGAKTLLEIKR